MLRDEGQSIFIEFRNRNKFKIYKQLFLKIFKTIVFSDEKNYIKFRSNTSETKVFST